MIDKNRLIAEFMGISIDGEFAYIKDEGSPLEETMPINQMEYHKSWDWLMPVIQKIETLGYTFEKNYQPIDKDWQSLIVKGNDILYQEFDNESIKASYYVVCELITQLWEKKIGFKKSKL